VKSKRDPAGGRRRHTRNRGAWSALAALALAAWTACAAGPAGADPLRAPHDRLPLGVRELLAVDSLASIQVPVETAGRVRGRAWSFAGEQAMNSGTGGAGILGSGDAPRDAWAGGADSRAIPDILLRIVGDRRLRARGHFDPLDKDFSRDTVQMIGRAFANQWQPVRGSVGPDGAIAQGFERAFSLFGRAIWLDESAHWRRGHALEADREQLYLPDGSPVYDYRIERGVASTRMGGSAALGVSPAGGQAVRVRASYDRDADDEGRNYQGPSQALRGLGVVADRLMYVQRAQWSGSVAGEHALGARGPVVTWSAAKADGYRVQPDRRESFFLRTSTAFFDSARREFGDTRERGRSYAIDAELPLGRRDRGSLRARWENASGSRDRAYRRFEFQPSFTADARSSPESLFAANLWTGYGGDLINETTLNTDNGREQWRQDAFGGELDLGPARPLRVVARLRREHAVLESGSFLPWDSARPVAHSRLDEVDWLPALTVAWSVAPLAALRFSADRAVTRPSADDVAPASTVDLRDGVRELGNPALHAARADRFTLDWETTAAERSASVHLFRTRLYDPIERRLAGVRGGWRRFPVNSGPGWDEGAVLGMRAGLGRALRVLAPLRLDVRAVVSSSRVAPGATDPVARSWHRWQGSAAGTDVSLCWSSRPEAGVFRVTLHHEGGRLEELGTAPRPDIWADPLTTLSARIDAHSGSGVRFTLSGDNLTNAMSRSRQGALETRSTRPGPAWAAVLALGR
jgi:hypothetical protein